MPKTPSQLALPTPGTGPKLPVKSEQDGSDKPESFEAYRRTPTKENLNNVLRDVDPVINKALTSFGGSYQSPVLKRRAQLIAANAIKTYDPKKGASVTTHLYNSLQQLRRLGPQMTEAVVVPEQVAIDMSKLDNADKELFNFLGRDASDAEIADHTGLSMKRIQKLRRLNMPVNEGAFRDMENPDIVEAPGVMGVNKDQQMIDYVYHDLSPLDQKVMELRTGYGGRTPVSTEEAAALLKRDYKWVSQRASIIQKKIADAIGAAGI